MQYNTKAQQNAASKVSQSKFHIIMNIITFMREGGLLDDIFNWVDLLTSSQLGGYTEKSDRQYNEQQHHND